MHKMWIHRALGKICDMPRWMGLEEVHHWLVLTVPMDSVACDREKTARGQRQMKNSEPHLVPYG